MRGWIVALLALAVLGSATPVAQAQDDFCYHPSNLTVNCDFNTFTDYSAGGVVRVLADGWTFLVTSGAPAIDQGFDSTNPPSQRIWSDGGSFSVVMYQRVGNLTPGATYAAGLVWAPYTSPDGSMMRQIGLDPTGGTNPGAASVEWGPEMWAFSRLTFLEKRAVATGSAVTMFVRVSHPTSYGADQIFLDGGWMRQDTTVPVQGVATSTAVPPTAIPPTAVPPTATLPLPSPTMELSATATPLPPTNTAVPASPTVLLPTATPAPSSTVAVATATAPSTSTPPSIAPSETPSPTLMPETASLQISSPEATTTRASTSTRRASPTSRATTTRRASPTPAATATSEVEVTVSSAPLVANLAPAATATTAAEPIEAGVAAGAPQWRWPSLLGAVATGAVAILGVRRWRRR